MNNRYGGRSRHGGRGRGKFYNRGGGRNSGRSYLNQSINQGMVLNMMRAWEMKALGQGIQGSRESCKYSQNDV